MIHAYPIGYASKTASLMRSLSDKEVLRIADPNRTGKVRVLLYSQLRELPLPGEALVLLYRTSKNYGHYTALITHDDGKVEFDDSYSLTPDRELRWNSHELNSELGQSHAVLSRLLREVPESKLEYNEKHWQSNSPGDVSCGYFAGVRCLLRTIPLKQYQRLIEGLAKSSHGTPRDVVVTIGTLMLDGDR